MSLAYRTLGVYFANRWYLEYLREYVSKVRKTEKTVLKSKGFTIDSDFEQVLAAYQSDQSELSATIARYRGDHQSDRWAELRAEVQQKKSALQVEGKSAKERAAAFAKLNYLLDYTVATPQPADQKPSANVLPQPGGGALELEALALELELELLDL